METKSYGNRGSDRLRADCPLPFLSAAKAAAGAVKSCPGGDKVGLMAATGAKQW